MNQFIFQPPFDMKKIQYNKDIKNFAWYIQLYVYISTPNK